MADMHLIGAERVADAGAAMRNAAEQMTRAAGTMDHTMEMHHRWMEDWLQRWQTVNDEFLEKLAKVLRP